MPSSNPLPPKENALFKRILVSKIFVRFFGKQELFVEFVCNLLFVGRFSLYLEDGAGWNISCFAVVNL